VKWSRRVEADLAPNRLDRALRALQAEGRPIIDLTLSNPTRAALSYPPDLLAGLAGPRALVYSPEPLGLPAAREAIAADYARRGVAIPPERIVLTASTSEAYSLLFKILCDPGDEVLVPRPSYPLFEHLTRLDATSPRPYDLEYHGAWSMDFASIEGAWSPRTRAVLAVSPNNPTGSFVKRHELEHLATLCAARGAAIIADEVFADYELIPGARQMAGQVLDCRDGLVFSLGGLSKSIGLPQAKLAWIGAAGSASTVQAALARLEIAADTYLSVSTPVQTAAAELLTRGAAIREQIQARVTSNYQQLRACGAETPACGVLRSEGGWYAVLRVPSLVSEEDLVLALLTKDGVLTHPGYFFDFPSASYLVVSLLPTEATFREGVTRVFRHFACPTHTTRQ
jgi:aspartate/methionine/tyrosine aminotransferase